MKYPVKQLKLSNFQWISLVLQTELPCYSKALAMYLSTFMNLDQDIAWPSLRRIQKELSITRATACKYLDLLEEEGWIIRERGSLGKNTKYIIGFPKAVEGVVHQMNHVVHHMNHGGSPDEPWVVHHTDTNNTFNNTSNNTLIKKDYVSPDGDTRKANGVEFEKFWEHWPVKRNKQKAKQAFIRKKFDIDDVQTLIDDVVERVRHDPQWKKGYIPHCSTYLNGNRWEDSYEN